MSRILFDAATAKQYPRFRVYVRKQHGAAWESRRMLSQFAIGDSPERYVTDSQPGCRVEHLSRVLMPGIGQAIIEVRFGTINGRRILPDANWKLNGWQLRVDALIDGGDEDGDSDWRTVWWGVVQRTMDSEAPAAITASVAANGAEAPRRDASSMVRRFIAYDPTWSLAQRFYDRHWFEAGTISSGAVRRVAGPASFNVGPDGTASGNRGAQEAIAGTGAYGHTVHGAVNAVPWTDRNVVDTILALAGDQVPIPLTVDDDQGLLATASAWHVPHGTTYHGVLSMVLDRSRGLGCAFFDWDGERVDAATAGVLRIYPQTIDDVVAPAIVGPHQGTHVASTMPGARTAGTTQTIILTGDHRVTRQEFSIGDDDELLFDRVETVGDPIQVVVTIGANDGSMEAGWASSLEDEYDAASTDERGQIRYQSVLRTLRINGDWNLATGTAAADATPTLRCDYRCDDSGSIVTPTSTDATKVDTGVDSLRILGFLPIPAGVDAATGAAISGQPAAGSPRLRIYQRSGPNAVANWSPVASPQVLHQAIHFSDTGDPSSRPISSTWESLLITCGIELPHHVSMATDRIGGPRPAKRVQQIRMPSCKLCLGHRGAIVGIDSGTTPKRIGESAPIVYRDDRAAMARRHALACAWYLVPRRNLQYVVRMTCALLPSFSDSNGSQAHARLGHVIERCIYAGKADADPETLCRTVVSRISYDSGATTVVCDWSDLR